MKRKWLLYISLAFLMVFASTAYASAQPDGIQVIVDEQNLVFDQPPIIENGHTFVPLRVIFEALGARVDWNNATRTVTAIKDDVTVALTIGDDILYRNGVGIKLDVQGRIANGRTLVPARAVAESFGAYVDWDIANRTVIIDSNNGSYKAAVERILRGEKKNSLRFGGFSWRVLDVQDGKALIITEDIVEWRPYNIDYTAVTWETCSLRKYLNGEFLKRFTQENQDKIIETKIENPDNLWYGTPGGNSTLDKIFLLSIDEADRYFGDSGDYRDMRRKTYFFGDYYGISGRIIDHDEGTLISNSHDSDRKANYYEKGLYGWQWWLRSTGAFTYQGPVVNVEDGKRIANLSAAKVFETGYIDVLGNAVNADSVGVRPVMWLNLE